MASQALILIRIDAGEFGPELAENTAIMTINGWQAINITRSLAGEIEVFLNGTSYLQCTDLTYTTSDNFLVCMTKNSMFDNVVVSGTELPTPPMIPGFPAVTIAIGISLALGVGWITRRRRKIT